MSIRNVDLNSEEWRELVFENRNKEFGAYYLRKTSSRRHLFALSLVIAGVIVLFLLIKFAHFSQIQYTLVDEYEIKVIELSHFILFEENAVKNQVKAEEISPLEEIAKFTQPVIVEDELIEQDLKDFQEIFFSSDSIDTSSAFEEDTLLPYKGITQLNQESDIVVTEERYTEAKFQDGRIDLLRYIYQNIEYPSAAYKQRINGRVICSFIINEDGSISDVTLVQGLYIFLDDEVLRVINSMPVWQPAMEYGKPVKVKYVVPVVFRLN